jgi:hypothetical protein
MLRGFWITLTVSLTLVTCGRTPSAGPAFPALPSHTGYLGPSRRAGRVLRPVVGRERRERDRLEQEGLGFNRNLRSVGRLGRVLRPHEAVRRARPARPGFPRAVVAHTDVEFATLLEFTEETLGLKSLGATDATPYLHDLDDFFQPQPQPFTKIKIPARISFPCSVLPKAEPKSTSRWLRMDGDD